VGDRRPSPGADDLDRAFRIGGVDEIDIAYQGLPRRVFRRTCVSESTTIFRPAEVSKLFAVHSLVQKA
jgi:hypothetical protein